jgi:hypothetical protein
MTAPAEHPTQALSGMTRNDRDLLDVTRSVRDVRDQISHGDVSVVRDHPRPASVYIASEQLKAERFIIRDRVHANLSKDLPGLPLDLLQARKVREIGVAQRHRIAHAVLHNQTVAAQGAAAAPPACQAHWPDTVPQRENVQWYSREHRREQVSNHGKTFGIWDRVPEVHRGPAYGRLHG